MLYQLGWATLRATGLSVSEFRAIPTDAPDNERGVAIEFADEDERDAFLRETESAFARRRFTNAADAFDTVRRTCWSARPDGRNCMGVRVPWAGPKSRGRARSLREVGPGAFDVLALGSDTQLRATGDVPVVSFVIITEKR